MKKNRIIVFFLICIFALTGCEQSFKIPLQQSTENITQVELLDHRSGEFIVLHAFQNDEIANFMELFLQLRCYKYLGGPQGEFGDFAVKIYYADGGADLFGTGACMFTSPGEEDDFEGWLYLHKSDLIPLFAEYVNSAILPRTKD